jgi:hypothetical protein
VFHYFLDTGDGEVKMMTEIQKFESNSS